MRRWLPPNRPPSPTLRAQRHNSDSSTRIFSQLIRWLVFPHHPFIFVSSIRPLLWHQINWNHPCAHTEEHCPLGRRHSLRDAQIQFAYCFAFSFQFVHTAFSWFDWNLHFPKNGVSQPWDKSVRRWIKTCRLLPFPHPLHQRLEVGPKMSLVIYLCFDANSKQSVYNKSAVPLAFPSPPFPLLVPFLTCPTSWRTDKKKHNN